MSKLYTANHFKTLSQLKLLGEFAKIWFGKNFLVVILCKPIILMLIKCILFIFYLPIILFLFHIKK